MPSGRKGRRKPGAPSEGAPFARPSAEKSKDKSGESSGSQGGGQARRRKRPQVATTAFQKLKEMLTYVDLVVEVIDARVPFSTRHPQADELFGNRPRLLVLTKEDLADPNPSRALMEQLAARVGCQGMMVSLKQAGGKKELVARALDACSERMETLKRKGLLPRPMRVCVVGLPNVGKSSLINWLIGRRKTRVGDKPGVTRGTQWVRVHPRLELLDTPGILPPVAFDGPTKQRLAMFNLLPLSNYDQEEVARQAIVLLRQRYPENLERFVEGLSKEGASLEELALSRNLLSSGASPDVTRAAALVLSDVRDGKLGRLTLDP